VSRASTSGDNRCHAPCAWQRGCAHLGAGERGLDPRLRRLLAGEQRVEHGQEVARRAGAFDLCAQAAQRLRLARRRCVPGAQRGVGARLVVQRVLVKRGQAFGQIGARVRIVRQREL
jgi:hypothetical protein